MLKRSSRWKKYIYRGLLETWSMHGGMKALSRDLCLNLLTVVNHGYASALLNGDGCLSRRRQWFAVTGYLRRIREAANKRTRHWSRNIEGNIRIPQMYLLSLLATTIRAHTIACPFVPPHDNVQPKSFSNDSHPSDGVFRLERFEDSGGSSVTIRSGNIHYKIVSSKPILLLLILNTQLIPLRQQ